MGIDLILLPITQLKNDYWYSHTVIPLRRRSKLFEEVYEIEEIKGKKVLDSFNSYLGSKSIGEGSYGHTYENGYDSPLKYILIEELLNFKENEDVIDNWDNQAAWEYLTFLPKKTKIALYWC